MMGNLGGSYADSKLAQASREFFAALARMQSPFSQVLFNNALARRLPPNVQALVPSRTECKSRHAEIPGCDARLASSYCAVIAPA